jgi:cyclic pyranopterin phosphate synthase
MGARRSGGLSHVDVRGRARMVNVETKPLTRREAVAAGSVSVSPKAMEIARRGGGPKGNVIETARLAGLMAAKRTADLIPLCHPLNLEHVDLEIEDGANGYTIRARVRSTGKTGVEMEALTAVSIAALTIYDMLKAADRTMVIDHIRLVHKSGGRSGVYDRAGEPESGKG